MEKSILKRKYKLLKHAGEDKKADKLLRQIQGKVEEAAKETTEESTVEESEEVVSESVEESTDESAEDVVEEDVSDIDTLAEIKGIGPETVSDLKKIYSDLAAVKLALINNEVPLRNDIVKKLKNHLIEE